MLMRADKPTGSALLFWPCGPSTVPSRFKVADHARSLGYHTRVYSYSGASDYAGVLPVPVRAWRMDHAWCGMYDKRHVGQKV